MGTKGSYNQLDAIKSWNSWNEESRTLQRKVGNDVYWIISRMSLGDSVNSNVCSIERWSNRRSPSRDREFYSQSLWLEMFYIKENLNPPRDGDNWYNCPPFSTVAPHLGLQPFHRSGRTSLKVTGFPTTSAAVNGSGHNGLEARLSFTRN